MARSADPDKRRALALQAVSILEDEGLSISTARLAEALGIKRPTLLYYFPTTADILEHALEQLLREQMAFVLERVERHEHPVDRLQAQLCAVLEFHRGRERRLLFLTQAIATSAGSRVSAILEIGDQIFRAQREAAKARLARGMAEGSVARCDPDAVVSLVRALTDGLIVQRVMTGVELEPVVALIATSVFDPLRASPSASGRVAPTAPRSSRSQKSVSRKIHAVSTAGAHGRKTSPLKARTST